GRVVGAGVVTEVGDAAGPVGVGDRVMGLFDAVGPVAVTDAALLTAVPGGWSWTRAAGSLGAYVVAYHVLADVVAPSGAATLLVAEGTGSVGRAVPRLAPHLGVDIVDGAADFTLDRDGALVIRRADAADEGRGVAPPEPGRVRDILAALAELMPPTGSAEDGDVRDGGPLIPLDVTAWDVRQAPAAVAAPPTAGTTVY
ncbi:hypothetical protein G3I23_30370, partial [Streptomyces sp. SID10115]|nr:hypothetical protein [Streptomyces sp. SID10115]